VGEGVARPGALHPGRDALHHAADDRHGEELGAYRARFVEPIRIRAGVAFWRANQRWLGQAEDLYGVAAEIVVGIVGVESIFGRQMGDFRVIDALATLAFDFPSGRKDRSAFFRTSSRPGSSSARAKASIRSPGAAATPARSAWRSSCRRASTSTRSTSTATATSTCTPTPPT
jgi:membrane-bound lytic murein transglycosylase B